MSSSAAAPTSDSASSAAAPTSSAAPTSTATSSAQQTSSASQQQSSTATSSGQQSNTSSATSASSASGSASQSGSQSTSASGSASSAASSAAASSTSSSLQVASSAVYSTSTDSAGHIVSTAPPVITNTLTSTDASGQIFTITQIVRNPGATGDSSNAATSTGFFGNTGAVAGTFAVAGLAVTGILLTFVWFILKRRRRSRLDRDVAAAAAAAAAAASHRDALEDDDEKTGGQYGDYYASTAPALDIHGQPQPDAHPYRDYEDPAGGYDAYAANMNHHDHMADYRQDAMGQYDQSGYAGQHQYPPQASHQQNMHGADGGYYFDPKQAYDFAEEDPYGGYDDVHHASGHQRSGSAGSINRDGEERGLKVTNV